MRQWHDGSSCLVLLSVENRDHLLEVLDVVHAAQAPHAAFVEPDVGNEHTAFAVLPSAKPGSRLMGLLASLPLQGEEVASAT